MKRALIIVMLVSCQMSFAQQKKKQIQRLLEQIAANQVYIGYLEKGYGIVRDGLYTIRDIKNGDFNLHFSYFDSLKKVNPKIKRWGKVADIIACQVRIIRDTKQTIKDMREAQQFTHVEMDYCKKVFDNLLDECVKNLDELVFLVTDGSIALKDDERMKRIDQLYSVMLDKYSFTSSFSTEMGILSVQRLTEQVDINYSKKINGYR